MFSVIERERERDREREKEKVCAKVFFQRRKVKEHKKKHRLMRRDVIALFEAKAYAHRVNNDERNSKEKAMMVNTDRPSCEFGAVICHRKREERGEERD